MLLKNVRYLITQNNEREILENVDIRISNGKINQIEEKIEAGIEENTEDFSDKILMPGLINCHTHVSMALFRGISDDKELDAWLQEDIFPAEQERDSEDVYNGAKLGIVEMLKTGTTCFNDQYGPENKVAEAVEETGIRAVLGQGVIDIERDTEEALKESREFIEEWMDHDRINLAVNPHSVYTCSTKALEQLVEQSEEFELPIHVHVSETEKENQDMLDEKEVTPTEYLEELGVLDRKVIAAHCTHLTSNDLEILAEKDIGIAHNPCANLKLGSGIADTSEYIEKGIDVGLGTDGVASNNNFNMFEEMKFASLLQKNGDPTQMSAQKALDMATINAAKVLGMEDKIGSIEKGKKADLVAIDLKREDLSPLYGKKGLISNLVFSFNGEVDDVFVDGEQLLAGRQLKFNVDESKAEIQDFADSILK